MFNYDQIDFSLSKINFWIYSKNLHPLAILSDFYLFFIKKTNYLEYNTILKANCFYIKKYGPLLSLDFWSMEKNLHLVVFGK